MGVELRLSPFLPVQVLGGAGLSCGSRPWWHPEVSRGVCAPHLAPAVQGGAAPGGVAAVLQGFALGASDTDPKLCFNINSVCVCV